MNGDNFDAGREPTDSRKSRDSALRLAYVFQDLEKAVPTLEARGCWRLAREIADEVARYKAEVETQLDLFRQVQQRGVDGQNPQDAGEKEVADIRYES